MTIDLSQIDREQFYVNEHIWNGDVLFLVTPRQIGVKWDNGNLHFRSSVWNHSGQPVSLSYKKFFNWGENHELSPLPKDLNNTSIISKIDGSTIIISKYKGKFLIRSRGTINAYTLATGAEMDILKQKYPKLFEMDGHLETWDFSVITEYISPNNQIVIRYDKVDFILTGLIFHNDYSLMPQDALNHLAKELEMPRPEIFQFSTIDDLLSNVDKWIGLEGVVAYVNSQQLLKIKAAKYLFLHRMKSELSSCEKIMDVWFSQNKPSYLDFYNYIHNTFDYELAEYCRENIKKIISAYEKVKDNISKMKEVVIPLLSLSRKDSALIILEKYQCHSSYLFKLLSGKELDDKDIRKLLISFLE